MRLRGEILRLLADEQRPMDGRSILVFFEQLHRDVVYEEIVAELRWLRGRGYVTYSEKRDRDNRRLPAIEAAEITDRGRDVLLGHVPEEKGVDAT